MQINKSQISVARVLSESDSAMVLEVLKDDTDHFTLDPDGNNTFYFILFTTKDDSGSLVLEKPWDS